MNPIEFPGHNTVIAKDQPQYLPLPAFLAKDQEGTVLTHWELSDEEMEQIIRTKTIALRQLTFGGNLQPIKLFVPMDQLQKEVLALRYDVPIPVIDDLMNMVGPQFHEYEFIDKTVQLYIANNLPEGTTMEEFMNYLEETRNSKKMICQQCGSDKGEKYGDSSILCKQCQPF